MCMDCFGLFSRKAFKKLLSRPSKEAKQQSVDVHISCMALYPYDPPQRAASSQVSLGQHALASGRCTKLGAHGVGLLHSWAARWAAASWSPNSAVTSEGWTAPGSRQASLRSPTQKASGFKLGDWPCSQGCSIKLWHCNLWSIAFQKN